MSLGDHLEELRARLILIVLGVAVGLMVTLFFGTRLVSFLESPYYHAMRKFTQEKEDTAPATEVAVQPPEENLVSITISEQNLKTFDSLKPGDHILATINFYKDDPNHPAFAKIAAPGQTEKKSPSKEPTKRLQTIELPEGMLVYLKVCLVFGFIIVSPWVFWQAWAFISAGLYQHEKKFIKMAAPASALLFITGAVFFMAVVAPLIMTFFIRFNRILQTDSNWTLRNYMSFVLTLTLVFGAAFQMPIAIVFSEMMGLISISTLARNRKYVILGLLFIAAVATPPDVISQILLAIPLYVLYEGSILACRFLRKKQKQSNSS